MGEDRMDVDLPAQIQSSALGMTLQAFAGRFCVIHVAVVK
jgi:hypothetical protein